MPGLSNNLHFIDHQSKRAKGNVNEYSLSARRLDGQAGYNSGKLVEAEDIELSADDSKVLKVLIQDLIFSSYQQMLVFSDLIATNGFLKAFHRATTTSLRAGARRRSTPTS
jgi:hypothetical protein